MTWVLTILMSGLGSGAGTSALQVQFETQALCTKAAYTIRLDKINANIGLTCVQVKK